MEITNWKKHVSHLNELLSTVGFTNSKGKLLQQDEGFKKWLKRSAEIRKGKKIIFLIGNGASASMASHFAADLGKNAGIHTQVFSDLSLITAISNDLGYENVFSEPLKRRGGKGDMLVAISSSGKSPNIIKAVELANSIEMTVVTLSGMSPENPLRKLGTTNIYAPGNTYGLVETAHAAILHYWMDLMVIEKED